MEKIKILYITARADFGGGPIYINTVINNLSTNWEIYIACPDDKPFYDIWLNNEKVKDIFILPHRKLRISRLFQLFNFIRSNEIHLIQSNGKGAGIYSRLLKLFNTKIKVIHAFHGVHMAQLNYVKKLFYIVIERILSQYLTDLIINVSKGEQKNCLKHNFYEKNKSVIIYNGVEFQKSYQNPYLEASRKFIIVSLTRYDYAKNMQLAYKIAESLKENIDINFVWIGDGEDRQELENMAKRDNVNIKFLGFKDNKEIGNYLKNANIYLSTSRWEGLPLALLEANSVGLPIVASDVIGNNEVVIHDFNGFLFNIPNFEVAKSHILELYNNRSKLEAFSINAENVFKEKFTVDLMIDKHEKAYRILSQK